VVEARLTNRLREKIAEAIASGNRAVSEVAGEDGERAEHEDHGRMPAFVHRNGRGVRVTVRR